MKQKIVSFLQVPFVVVGTVILLVGAVFILLGMLFLPKKVKDTIVSISNRFAP